MESHIGYALASIDWRTGEVQMTKCPDEYRKKWRTGRQMKPG